MSKLIVDMPMPQRCCDCDFADGVVCMAKGGVYGREVPKMTWIKTRPSWCPILGVLPDEHGDLIDRDKAKDAFDSSFLTFRMKDGETMRGFYQRTIVELPTVIAAERKDDAK